jgi:uncharacterized damage-inducible protein DinB
MDPLSEAFQHHLWATETLIGHLRKLPEAALSATAAGVYGAVAATLSHMLAADGRYLSALDGMPPPTRTPGPDAARSLDELAEALRNQTVRWSAVLAGVDTLDVTLESRGERPELPHATNLLLAQALHHGTDHRTHICTVLSANGYETPDLDVWSYWMERHAE